MASATIDAIAELLAADGFTYGVRRSPSRRPRTRSGCRAASPDRVATDRAVIISGSEEEAKRGCSTPRRPPREAGRSPCARPRTRRGRGYVDETRQPVQLSGATWNARRVPAGSSRPLNALALEGRAGDLPGALRVRLHPDGGVGTRWRTCRSRRTGPGRYGMIDWSGRASRSAPGRSGTVPSTGQRVDSAGGRPPPASMRAVTSRTKSGAGAETAHAARRRVSRVGRTGAWRRAYDRSAVWSRSTTVRPCRRTTSRRSPLIGD